MFWFLLCCAVYGTIAAPQRIGAFVFPFTKNNNHKHGRKTTTSFELREATSENVASVVDSVVECINELYPPQGLDQRIALSRKDGYWPFISTGEDPPQEFVYGEFDVSLLDQSLNKARQLLLDETSKKEEKDIVFCDLGSGTGRLVLAAAALHPNWKLCKGIELLESIYEEALEKVESCRRTKTPMAGEGLEETSDDHLSAENVLDDSNSHVHATSESEFSLTSKNGPLPLAPIVLECGSFTDPYSSFFDADILFCFSSCLPQSIQINLARSIGRQCLPGTIVITTEYALPSGGVLDPLPDDVDYPSGEYEFEMMDTFSGNCTAVGGTSTVYIQKVVKSVGTGTLRVQPQLPVSELAYRAIQYMEESDSTTFLRQVSNQMAFLGFPDSWRPKI